MCDFPPNTLREAFQQEKFNAAPRSCLWRRSVQVKERKSHTTARVSSTFLSNDLKFDLLGYLISAVGVKAVAVRADHSTSGWATMQQRGNI